MFLIQIFFFFFIVLPHLICAQENQTSVKLPCTSRTSFAYDLNVDNGMACDSFESASYAYFPGSAACSSISSGDKFVIANISDTAAFQNSPRPAIPQIKVYGKTGNVNETCEFTVEQLVTNKETNETRRIEANRTSCLNAALEGFVPSNVSKYELSVINTGKNDCSFTFNFQFQDINNASLVNGDAPVDGSGNSLVPSASESIPIVRPYFSFFFIAFLVYFL